MTPQLYNPPRYWLERRRLRLDAAGALWFGRARVIKSSGWRVPYDSVRWRTPSLDSQSAA